MEFDFLPLDFGGIRREVGFQIPFRDAFLEVLGDRNATEINLIEVSSLKKIKTETGIVIIITGELFLVDRYVGAIFPRALPVEDQRDVELDGHLHRKCLLPQNEQLKRMQQMEEGVAGEEAMRSAVGSEEVVVESSDVDPVLKIAEADVRVQVRCPCDGERVHAVLVLSTWAA